MVDYTSLNILVVFVVAKNGNCEYVTQPTEPVTFGAAIKNIASALDSSAATLKLETIETNIEAKLKYLDSVIREAKAEGAPLLRQKHMLEVLKNKIASLDHVLFALTASESDAMVVDEGVYKIVSAKDSLVLDVHFLMGNEVVQTLAPNETLSNPFWRAKETDVGEFVFVSNSTISKGKTFALDQSHVDSLVGTLIVWNEHRGLNQQWSLEPIPQNKSLFYIRSKQNGKVLQSNGPKSDVVVATQDSLNDQQHWTFQKAAN